jgi:leader peptidase (prepilin peptidase) / N-methyltransferase
VRRVPGREASRTSATTGATFEAGVDDMQAIDHWSGPTAVVLAALLGAAAGACARWLLGRLERGAVVRPPLCEAGVATAWAAVGAGWAAGVVPGGWVPALLGLGWLGVATAVVDLRHRRIPDALTLPALPIAVACTVPLGGRAVLAAVLGAAVAIGAHAAVHLLAPRAMGAGDVKLAGPLGAVLGAAGLPAIPLAAGLAALLTAVVGVGGLATGALGRRSGVPHGPSMVVAAGAVTAWLVIAASGIPPPR